MKPRIHCLACGKQTRHYEYPLFGVRECCVCHFVCNITPQPRADFWEAFRIGGPYLDNWATASSIIYRIDPVRFGVMNIVDTGGC